MSATLKSSVPDFSKVVSIPNNADSMGAISVLDESAAFRGWVDDGCPPDEIKDMCREGGDAGVIDAIAKELRPLYVYRGLCRQFEERFGYSENYLLKHAMRHKAASVDARMAPASSVG